MQPPAALRARLDAHGYLYFKEILPRDHLTRIFLGILHRLQQIGILIPEGFVMNPKFTKQNSSEGEKENPKNKRSTLDVSASIMEVACGSKIRAIVRHIFGSEVVPFSHKSLEVSPKGESHSFHMDSVFLTKGTKLILTAWVPLTDLTLSRGPLVILQGSNCSPDTEKLRRTYGLYDAYSDTREGNGMLSDDPQNLEFLADRFVTAPFRRGDLVLFTIYSLHSFLTNATSEVRISAESKWFMKNDEFGPDLRYRGHTILKKTGVRGENFRAKIV